MSESSAEQILEQARERFGKAEVYEETVETLSVNFEDNRLKEINARQSRGVGLRVIQKGRIGFASTTDLRDTARLVEMAAASAQYGDQARFEFPGQPAETPQAETWDDAVTAVTAEQMVEMGREGLQMSRQAADGYLYSCGIGRSTGQARILNTGGLDFAYRSTAMSAHVAVQEVSDEGLLQVYEYKHWSRPFESVADLAETVLDKMKRAATVAPARLETMPMIFTPKALGNLLGPVAVALNGKNVHKGSSVLRGRIGERILDGRLTIVDDPSVPFAPGTCPIDDEGTPTQPRAIFEGGVLQGYLTDLQTAALLETEPSGHGFRGYSSRPSPSSTNTVVAAGDASLEEMLSMMGRGVIVEQTLGSGQSNVLSGEISVNLDLGFLVEDGEVCGRVKNCMVAGNVYEMLKQVEAVGSERRWVGSAHVPPIMVGGLKLAAQG